ncbi:hypothetical protein BC781_1011280 [Sediminitomix flava]|uniref:Uncharacterized protein n=1 Tax=Sediminitomix flava TaxID=379075 RepID=A0A315ZH98_SEDFL|nr:hypothetical protein BC781_1011280 [Sediminitomix flava]
MEIKNENDGENLKGVIHLLEKGIKKTSDSEVSFNFLVSNPKN